MKILIAIDLLATLLDKDLPKESTSAGFTLHYPDLYKGTMLSHGTLERLQNQTSLIEMQLSEREMLLYHQEFTQCDQQHNLTFEDYVAVAHAKSEGCILLANKGFLSRYACCMGAAVMDLKELEELCLQRRRQVHNRKERLRLHFSHQRNRNSIENEPMQQPIDDDTSF